MLKEIDRNKFSFYRYKREDELYVAVPTQYCKVIDAAIEQYGSLAAVPDMKTVRGIFAKRTDKSFRYMDKNMQENDVTINQLEPLRERSSL
jgi:hypothetical protein